jgi:hypothetical protein
LIQIGTKFIGALAAGGPGAATHSWIERDSVTGAQTLKVPLPPETASQLADALTALAEGLRGCRST